MVKESQAQLVACVFDTRNNYPYTGLTLHLRLPILWLPVYRQSSDHARQRVMCPQIHSVSLLEIDVIASRGDSSVHLRLKNSNLATSTLLTLHDFAHHR